MSNPVRMTAELRLGPREIAELEALEARAIAHDGGRLKLEWITLRSRSGAEPNDFLAWDGDTLVGFLGLYAFGRGTLEIAGVVDPAHRRRGIGSALLDAALPICRERPFRKALLVTPTGAAAGAAFARHHGAVLDHAEHALVLEGPPRAAAEPHPDLVVRRAEARDFPAVSRLLANAFGFAASDVASRMADSKSETRVVERAGAIIGTLRVTRDGDTVDISGFAIDAALRGQGVGRDVLVQTCHAAHRDGAARVALEVLVDNAHALGLYASVGFVRAAGEDYWALPGFPTPSAVS